MIVAGAIVAGVSTWVAAPLMKVGRRRTLDQQKLAGIRAEVARNRAVTPITRSATLVAAPLAA